MGHRRAVKVAKWGNSLAVRLPAALVAALGLKEGDEVEVRTGEGAALVVEKKPDAAELFERLAKFQGRMPKGYRFDRDEANSRDDG